MTQQTFKSSKKANPEDEKMRKTNMLPPEFLSQGSSRCLVFFNKFVA